MNSINISLPNNLSSELDLLVETGGFSSRSEFVKELLKEHIARKNLKLEKHNKTTLARLKKELNEVGYNKKFVQSVVSGMEKSSPYAKNQTA